MDSLTLRIDALSNLGHTLSSLDPILFDGIIEKAFHKNPWFTKENIQLSIEAIINNYLNKNKLEEWISDYSIDYNSLKSVGLVMAGNIPLVGFHDFISVFVSGHRSLIKLSSKDEILFPFILSLLNDIYPTTSEVVEIVGRLKNFDAIIATGSNASSVYFESYFGKYPNIIRKNRNAVAVLHGKESRQDLLNLGIDIFRYFGMGCRNVSKIYVSRNYNIEILLAVLHEYRDIVLHHKYKNNFDYNCALFLLNKQAFLNNGSILLKEDDQIPSRIASLHYSFYDQLSDVENELKVKADQIQCVCGDLKLSGFNTIPFGQAQCPELADYADGVDTLKFLSSI